MSVVHTVCDQHVFFLTEQLHPAQDLSPTLPSLSELSFNELSVFKTLQVSVWTSSPDSF